MSPGTDAYEYLIHVPQIAMAYITCRIAFLDSHKRYIVNKFTEPDRVYFVGDYSKYPTYAPITYTVLHPYTFLTSEIQFLPE